MKLLIHDQRPAEGVQMGKLLLTYGCFPGIIHLKADRLSREPKENGSERNGARREITLENSPTFCSFAKCLRIELAVKRLYLSPTSFATG